MEPFESVGFFCRLLGSDSYPEVKVSALYKEGVYLELR